MMKKKENMSGRKYEEKGPAETSSVGVGTPEKETLIVRLQQGLISLVGVILIVGHALKILLDDHYEVEFLSGGKGVYALVILLVCSFFGMLTLEFTTTKNKILASASYGLVMSWLYLTVKEWFSGEKDIDGIVLKNPWIKIRYKMDVSEAKNYVLTELYPGTSDVLEKSGITPEERMVIKKEIVEGLPYEKMTTIKGSKEAYIERIQEIIPKYEPPAREGVLESLSGVIVNHPWAVAAVVCIVGVMLYWKSGGIGGATGELIVKNLKGLGSTQDGLIEGQELINEEINKLLAANEKIKEAVNTIGQKVIDNIGKIAGMEEEMLLLKKVIEKIIKEEEKDD